MPIEPGTTHALTLDDLANLLAKAAGKGLTSGRAGTDGDNTDYGIAAAVLMDAGFLASPKDGTSSDLGVRSVAAAAKREALVELRERGDKADLSVSNRYAKSDGTESIRLGGKSEGVRLMLSLIDDALLTLAGE